MYIFQYCIYINNWYQYINWIIASNMYYICYRNASIIADLLLMQRILYYKLISKNK